MPQPTCRSPHQRRERELPASACAPPPHSAGLVAPLCQLGVRFDFSLPHVASINVSGHKYGLVYCGVAFQVWRSRAWLPKDMVLTGEATPPCVPCAGLPTACCTPWWPPFRPLPSCWPAFGSCC